MEVNISSISGNFLTRTVSFLAICTKPGYLYMFFGFFAWYNGFDACHTARIYRKAHRRGSMTIMYSKAREIGDEPPIRSRLTFRKITERRYEIPEHGRVLCRLWHVEISPTDNWPAVYAVEMKGLGLRRMYIIGNDAARARRLYAMLVRNTVTPCALRDVLEELL